MSARTPSELRARLLVELDEAARVIAPLWPIKTFIAVNPLWDLRHRGFEAAVGDARRWLGVDGYPAVDLLADAYESGRINDADLHAALDASRRASGSPARPSADAHDACATASPPRGRQPEIDREVAKWCAAHLAGKVAGGRSNGLYDAWRLGVAHDPGASRLAGRAGRARLAKLPIRPEDAILTCLDRLCLAPQGWHEEIAHQLCAMPGWSGLAKWRSLWAPRGDDGRVLELIDLVAVRLAYDTELRCAASDARPKRRRSSPRRDGAEDGARRSLDGRDPRATLAECLPASLAGAFHRLTEGQAARVWLAAFEGHYRDRLLGRLDRGPAREGLERPRAQIVCCIDPRSEGLRRNLESIGPYETYGFAGFFGVPMRFRAIGFEAVDLCPVLVSPSVEMTESPAPGAEGGARRKLAGLEARAMAAHSFESTREGPLSAFLLAEVGGLFAAPILAAKTLAPARFQRLRNWASQLLAPDTPTDIRVDQAETAMGGEEQTLFAETALRTMGFTKDFAPIVVLCGHGSTTENNPHESALDCGACGGNRGANSARAAAAILNLPEVRSGLAERGINVPASTWFVAAEHDTATDVVRIFDTHLVPDANIAALADVARDLGRAGSALAEERSSSLPRTFRRTAVGEVAARSADWAETQPEWGLARNAAFIVGPRTMTAGVDLERRAFLHSYEASLDPDGIALETILTAPMVVAHWINAQYYFSTVDPAVYGAGDKTVHNLVAGIGVTEGADLDLKLGLPLQSLFSGGRPYHEPMRLLCVVQAPLDLIEDVIGRNPVLRDLFEGEWVHLAARSDASGRWHLRGADGDWTPWTCAERAAHVAVARVAHTQPNRTLRTLEAKHG